MRRSLSLSIIALIAVLSLASPALAARGSANFSRYVAIGDSLTGGSEGANPINLVISHQIHSFPAVIARQAGVVDFQQPLISEPGILPELVLHSLAPLIIAPKSSSTGVPINLMLPRPYDNLGIPGARVTDLLTRTGAEQNVNPFYQIVLRGLGPAVGQALALQPTFITVWVGNNDVLGGVTSGMPSTMTPLAEFEASYETLLDTLITGAPNAGMVVANVPPIHLIPFANVIPPVLVDPVTRQPILGPDQNPIFLITHVGDQIVQLTPGSKVLLSAQSFLATGYGIPAALAPLIPLPNVGQPLPDAVTLTASEVAEISARQSAVNQVIAAASAERNIPLLDIVEVFSRIAAGIEVAGIHFDLSYITGGIMSLDGVHPTDIGYLFLANEFIKVINREYDARIPFASLTEFFANNAPPEASFVLLPRFESSQLLEAPWSGFVGPSLLLEPAAETTSPPPASSPRRGVRRGGR
ncbi:MAG TPA: SGNH/GDSL hydrolase family protein [Thermoanaerobaculia bacterium]|nr:SGNH/GDSL hydrolase family protein [Thermoanaerobaculia bacterium]